MQTAFGTAAGLFPYFLILTFIPSAAAQPTYDVVSRRPISFAPCCAPSSKIAFACAFIRQRANSPSTSSPSTAKAQSLNRPGTPSRKVIQVAPGSLRMTDTAMETFASQLSYSVARPIVDRTGLTGHFDFMLQWTPEPGEDGGPGTSGEPPSIKEPPTSDPNKPSLFTAITEQLGLRLRAARGPVEVLVIDEVMLPAPH